MNVSSTCGQHFHAIPDGARKSFYIDYLEETARVLPHLGVASVLSKTSKIGESARSFGLPLAATCCNGCGIATACRHGCYVPKTQEGRDGIGKRYEKNFQIAQRSDFDILMTGAIQKSGIRFIKLHVSGDFFSVAYIRAWIKVVTRCSHIWYWIYTRAWRVAEFLPALADLAACRNVQMWFSHDYSTGEPPAIEGVRRAWLSFHDESPDAPSDLVFRASLERKRLIKTEIGGVFVCPHYNGKERSPADCVTCGYCLPTRKEAK
jgi:hypothetical protein